MKTLSRVLLCMALLLPLALPSFAADAPKKGDFILGAGWAYSAPKEATDERLGDWTASLEYMVADNGSIRLDYYRLNEVEQDAETSTLTVVDPPGISLTFAPHFGNLSIPIGAIGVDTPDRGNAEFGVVAGVHVDFWTNQHIGLGFGGNYLYLSNTTIGQDSYDVRGLLRLKF